MKPLVYALVLGIVSCTASAQGQAGTTGSGTTPGQVTAGEQGTVKILSPKAGVKLKQNFLTVNFEMPPQASADSSPTFLLRLDDRDPVRTMATEHTFTGLTPGPHRLSVELVDANDTPVQGTRSQIDFVVLPASPSGGQSRPEKTDEPSEAAPESAQNPLLMPAAQEAPAAADPERKKDEAVLDTQEAAGPQLPGQSEPVKTVEPPDAAGAPSARDLPGTGSHLPLLSLIGFGVLVGGVVAALKSR
jgi:hypothetical protein